LEQVIAPFDLFLEEDCPDGFNCSNSKNPFMCPKNHHRMGNVIKKGARIPKFFCKFERPWDNIRCARPECFFAHLAKRHLFIKSKQGACAP
jgi:hypothetical protein